MKFVLIDRMSEFTPGERIVAHKSVSRAEEYLADHFPTFPVLPGVLMLEAAVQAAAWLVRAASDFENPLVLLRTARNVTYKSFVAPGETLTVDVRARSMSDGGGVFRVDGVVGDRSTLKAEIDLRSASLTAIDATLAPTEQRLRQHMRSLFEQLSRPLAKPAVSMEMSV